jgi:ERCC4-type nuclease
MMIERKTWKDLAASILDHRYKEQHARYVAWAAENGCAVWYILEGTKRFRTPAQEKRTLSAHVSLCFDNHVKLVETKHPTETMEWIHRVVSKIHTKGTQWLQSGFCGDSENDTTGADDTVASVSSTEKELARQKINKIGKKTHSIRSTWMAMLSCLYGMSVEKADAVI